MAYYDQVQEAAAAVRARLGAAPDVAVVLGSGLGDFANALVDSVSVPYERLPHWPASKVAGHEGRLVAGLLHEFERAGRCGCAWVKTAWPIFGTTKLLRCNLAEL